MKSHEVKLRKDSLCVQCRKTLPAGTIVYRDTYAGDFHFECQKKLADRQTKELAEFKRRLAAGEVKMA
jgi:hypothetical protein